MKFDGQYAGKIQSFEMPFLGVETWWVIRYLMDAVRPG